LRGRGARGRAPAAPDPARYRNALPVRCGSPLYVVRAQLVADDAALVAAADAFEREVPSSATLVLGVAAAGRRRAVVFARRLVDLDRVARAGAAKLSGHLLAKAKTGRMLISTARGLTSKPFEISDGRFELETGGPRDATIELVYTVGQVGKPFARVELGGGSPLFRRDGSVMTRINEARRVVGARPLVRRDQVGGCDFVPPQIDGIDVTDRARCFHVPVLELDDLADEIAYRPLVQDVLLTRAASLVEIAAAAHPEPAIDMRVLMQFEAMAPEAARQRVLELLRARWPQLVERKADGLPAVVEAWSRDPDVFASSAKYKPALDQVAATWTKTKTYYDALTTARDLETALALVKPDVTPTAADAAVVQVRGKGGAMLHAIAVVLELP
jgi:hypothetical protein